MNANLGENFYSYGWSEKLMKDDKNDAVDAAVFKFVEVPPSIFVSAAGGKPALLETKRDDFENYTLLVDFKWGEKTYGDRETKRRAAQILLNAGGPDGLFGLRPQCVAVDLSEGSAGGIQLVGADRKVLCKAKVTESPDKKRRVFDPNVPQPVNLASGEAGWNGVIARLGFPEPKDYKDEKGWHPRGDTLLTDLKPGQWNKVMIEARGASLKVFVNNMVRPVNEIHGLNVKKGRIGFTSNLADYSIGRITVELPGQ